MGVTVAEPYPNQKNPLNRIKIVESADLKKIFNHLTLKHNFFTKYLFKFLLPEGKIKKKLFSKKDF